MAFQVLAWIVCSYTEKNTMAYQHTGEKNLAFSEQYFIIVVFPELLPVFFIFPQPMEKKIANNSLPNNLSELKKILLTLQNITFH